MSVTPLVDLAAVINEEHALTYYAVMDALEHAILCGEALIEAKKQVPDGQWTKWIEGNLEMGSGAVSRYVRIATYREHLLAANDRPRSLNAAITYLKAIEAPRLVSGSGRKPTFDVDEARRLRELGVTYREIGKMLGVSDQAVQQQLKPDQRRRKMRQNAADKSRRRAEARVADQERVDQEVANIGGDIAGAYILLRRCEVVFEKVIAEVDMERGQALQPALQAVRRAMDVVTNIFGVKRRKRRAR